jgi:hypothetical protein
MNQSLVLFCFTLLFYTTSTFAGLPAVIGWEAFSGVISGVVSSATEYLWSSPDNNTKKINELQTKITELQQQLEANKKASEFPSAQALAKAEQQLQTLQEVFGQLQKNNSVEQRVAALEKVYTVTGDEQKTAVLEKQALKFDITYSFREKNQGELQTLENGAVLNSGDTYKIVFTPKQDAHVYIFQVDGSDKIWRLFPIKRWEKLTLNQSSRVKAGKTYYAPTQTKSFQLDQQVGTEKIYFIATTTPDNELEQLNETTHPKAKPLIMAARGIAGIVNDPKTQSKQAIETEDGKVFQLTKQQLLGRCENQGCVNIMTFEHR